MRRVEARAPAKLNLGLEILGRRADGYHEIRTILQTVSIYDQIRLRPAPDVQLTCTDSSLEGNANLAARAVERLRKHAHVTEGAEILLEKDIPVAAGLGGGSSDAAACLWAAATLWSINPPGTELADVAARVGSDVPFFLRGGTMSAAGRGELLTALPHLTGVWFVVVAPRVTIPQKTTMMYHALREDDLSDGSAVDSFARTLASGAIAEWQLIVNDFERAARELMPELDRLRETFREAGASFVAMTGAGPSHFTATADREHAEAIYRKFSDRFDKAVDVFLCEPIAAVPPLTIV